MKVEFGLLGDDQVCICYLLLIYFLLKKKNSFDRYLLIFIFVPPILTILQKNISYFLGFQCHANGFYDLATFQGYALVNQKWVMGGRLDSARKKFIWN